MARLLLHKKSTNCTVGHANWASSFSLGLRFALLTWVRGYVGTPQPTWGDYGEWGWIRCTSCIKPVASSPLKVFLPKLFPFDISFLRTCLPLVIQLDPGVFCTDCIMKDFVLPSWWLSAVLLARYHCRHHCIMVQQCTSWPKDWLIFNLILSSANQTYLEI